MALRTWNGLTSTDWNTDTNWTPNFIPTSADDVIIDATAPGDVSLGGSNVSCKSLNCTGFINTLDAGYATINVVDGDCILSATMTLLNANLSISTGITSNGKIPLTVTADGGTSGIFTLGDDLTVFQYFNTTANTVNLDNNKIIMQQFYSSCGFGGGPTINYSPGSEIQINYIPPNTDTSYIHLDGGAGQLPPVFITSSSPYFNAVATIYTSTLAALESLTISNISASSYDLDNFDLTTINNFTISGAFGSLNNLGGNSGNNKINVGGNFVCDGINLNAINSQVFNVTGSATAHYCDIQNCDFSGGTQLNATDKGIDGGGNINVDFGQTNVFQVQSANGSYGIGSVITIGTNFTAVINVTGAPRIQLDLAGTKYADYNNSSGNVLNFNYTVQSGDNTNDLATFNVIDLNGGEIKDTNDNPVDLTLQTTGRGSLVDNYDVIIDTISPTVVSVSSTNADGTYGRGQTIQVITIFSEPVTFTGTPRINLNTKPTNSFANFITQPTPTTARFQYNIVAGDASSDLDYKTTSSLELNSGTIKDIAGNDAVLTLSSPGSAGSLSYNKNIVVSAPISATNVTSPVANGTYTTGKGINITISYLGNVTVTGTPRLALNTTPSTSANYISGSGTSTLTFQYNVASGQTSPDLGYPSATSLALNGGTLKDVNNNNVITTLPITGGIGFLQFNKNIVIDSVIPTITNVTSDHADGTFAEGEVVDIKVVFSETVFRTGNPHLLLNTNNYANYLSGSGTNTLVFRYIATSGDETNIINNGFTELDYINSSALDLNGGTIKDAINNANLTLPTPGNSGSLGFNKNIMFDTIFPTVINVTSDHADGTFGIDEVIDIQVQFDEAVLVDTGGGTPFLNLNVGGSVANYVSGSGTDTLTFEYVVISGDNSADLDYADNTALDLNGGTISDLYNHSLSNPVSMPADPGQPGSLGDNKDIVISTSNNNVAKVKTRGFFNDF